MSETPQLLAERLLIEGDKALVFFKSFPKERWEMSIYTDGAQWRLRDIIAHFVSAEISFLQLFKNIRAGCSGVPDGFSIDQYNDEQVSAMQDRTFECLLDDFKAARYETVEWVGSLSNVDLEMVGKHPFLSSTTLAEMIKMSYLHNNIHMRDIRRLVANQDP